MPAAITNAEALGVGCEQARLRSRFFGMRSEPAENFGHTNGNQSSGRMTPPNILVLQSHRQPVPHAFLEECLASVRHWAQEWGYDYRFLDDELFAFLDAQLLSKTRSQPVVATDLGRLQWLQACLADGYDAVVWLDADTLVLDPLRFTLPSATFVLGRETWIQERAGRPRLYSKVHNALIVARRGGVELPFYSQVAQSMVARHTGRMPAQFVGPKLLSALHNFAQFTVAEHANVLPPMVGRDLLQGAGQYLVAYQRALPVAPATLNLCTSSIDGGELTIAQMELLIERLQQAPDILCTGG